MIGRTLSHYEILESLGAGGMGEVFRARDTRLGREVAIKVLPPHRILSPNARQRFQREAMTASALNHPNIITIHEINCVDDVDFIVMEYVRGQTLSTLMQKVRLAARQVLRYGVQIADAVAKAHASGIVHRDLKPSNVMITEDGLVKVLDFGVAKFADPVTNDPENEQATQLTMPGSTTGTLLYMSPEQARGEEVDVRSDIFSFGVVLFQMFANKLPFYGANTMAVLHNLHFNPPSDLSALCPGVPKTARTLIEKMLEKEPAKRPQNMQEVAAELRVIARDQMWSLSQESAIAPTMADFPPPRPVRARWFSRVWIWGAVAALLIAGGSALLWRHTKKIVATTPASNEIVLDDNTYNLYKQARELLDHYDRPGNVENSIKLLEKAIQVDSNSAASYAALAEAYYRKNSNNPDPQWIKLASQYANRAVELNNDLAMSHISLGMVEKEQGRNDDAEKEFKTASGLDPKNASPHAWLAVLYDKTNHSRQATAELQLALKLNPQDWQTYMQVGLGAYTAGDYPKAAANWEQALKLEPDNVLALRNLGAVYHMLDRDDDAATALQRALEIQPNSDTYNNLGTIRFYQGHYQEAVAAFEKTVALSANSHEQWASLGDAYRWTPGGREKAEKAYRHAIQLIDDEIIKNPKNPGLKAALATYFAKVGDKDKALAELKLIESVPNKEAMVLFQSAIAYELCGQRDQALESLQASLKAGQSLSDIKNEPELTALRADPQYHLKILAIAK